jgi:hypothetical protein
MSVDVSPVRGHRSLRRRHGRGRVRLRDRLLVQAPGVERLSVGLPLRAPRRRGVSTASAELDLIRPPVDQAPRPQQRRWTTTTTTVLTRAACLGAYPNRSVQPAARATRESKWTEPERLPRTRSLTERRAATDQASTCRAATASFRRGAFRSSLGCRGRCAAGGPPAVLARVRRSRTGDSV